MADAVIVGAGPAGAATALLLARAGRDVLLLDRAAFPRRKPCGDCLSAAASGVLRRLGLLDAVLAENPARLHGWRITSPGGSTMTGRFSSAVHDSATKAAAPAFAAKSRPARVSARLPASGCALSLPRERLDRVLVEAAVASGVRLRERTRGTDVIRNARGYVIGVRARDLDGGDTYRLYAPLTVGADGLRSTVARRLGCIRRRPRLRKVSLSAHIRVAGESTGFGELHLTDGACLGLAPVERGPLHNLTLVMDADRFGPDVRDDPNSFFRHWLDRFPAVARRVASAVPAPSEETARGNALEEWAPPYLLASGPFDWPMRRVAADGAALVGDAAGYYDPFTGQGIFRALRSAELLAAAANRALGRGDISARSLRRYARDRAALLRGPVALQHIIEFVISRPRLADRVIAALARWPAAADALIAATGDLVSVHALLSRRLLATIPPFTYSGRASRENG